MGKKVSLRSFLIVPIRLPTPGKYFAGTVPWVEATPPIRYMLTDVTAWLFYLECAPRRTMPPLGVATLPPTLAWATDRPQVPTTTEKLKLQSLQLEFPLIPLLLIW